MSKRTVVLYLDDIRGSLNLIKQYTGGTVYDTFLHDQKTIDAVVRNLSIIGEAVKNVPLEVKLQHADVPWDEIIGMRNKIIHEYFGVDEEILWKTIQEDLPLFEKKILELIAQE
ncbi:MAG: DUF86 domain-containing protein [Parcubacteria group bacterium]|nr:DUF86 domain-containing protein [Parcubacteria group bacterium]